MSAITPKLLTAIFVLLVATASLVHSAPLDVTNRGRATQSSEWNGGQFPALLAIDGNPSSFSHTDGLTRNNAWELLLDREYEIAQVEITMRSDCCGGRMTGATLRLFDNEGDSVYHQLITDPGQGELAIFDLSGNIVARSLRIGFENGATNPSGTTTYVHLGEVRVFAEIDLLPITTLFQADPTSIASGQSSVLSWQVEGADQVELSGAGEVPSSGTMQVSPAVSKVYTLVASNEHGSRPQNLAVVVDGVLLPPRITEFMADNGNTIIRSDGSTPDWIEIWNPNPVAIDLAGYGLTDDPEQPARYLFPSTLLGADRYLIIDAAALPLDDVPATGFKLNKSADSYLALLDRAGQVLQSFLYPRQREDISFGMDWNGEARFFLQPTPGATGVAGSVEGFVADTQFSVDRGFYDDPQTVIISSETPASTIYTTTDGSEPSLENPTASVYTEPIMIATTTVLRAAAFRDGYLPTDVDTQTYIFPDHVPAQSSSPTGFPHAWVPNLNGVVSPVPALSHFGLNARILASLPRIDRAGERFEMRDALLSIPTMSLVMDSEELFDPAEGIHFNARNRGRAWERRASIEVIDPATGESEQANCGIRMHGGWNRFPEMLKKTFRLYFRSEYGDAKFNFPLFQDSVTDEFDRLILRSGNGKAWPSPWRALSGGGNSLERTTYLRDQFMRDLQAEMDNDHIAGRFVHLYLNGHYWGLYNPVERPDEHFASSHFGGQDEDYDVIKWVRGTGHQVAAGSDQAWNELVNLVRRGTANPTTFEAIAHRLDLPNFIDYMLLNYFAGNIDWVDSNVYALRDRARNGPFKFYCWDSEETFLSPGRDSTAQQVSDTSTELHHGLRSNAEYRVLFGDRVQKHLFHDGALTRLRTDATLMRRAWEIDRAIVGDSARWGSLLRPSDPYNRADWFAEIENLRNNYLGPRVGITLTQLRAKGLFPALGAPQFSPQRGGRVDPNFILTLGASAGGAGTIFYTTDGSDPRLPGGALSPTALPFEAFPSEEVLVSESSDWRYRDDGENLGPSDLVAGHDSYGAANWKHPSYDDSWWAVDAAPLGYGDIFGTTIQTTLSYGPNPLMKYRTTYFRRHFTVTESGRFSSLRLRLMRDDGAIVYLNGHEIARSDFPAGTTTVRSNTFATAASGSNEGAFHEFPVSLHLLSEGRNTLAVEVHQASANSSDLGFDLELAGEALAPGAQGISFTSDTLVRARVRLGNEWSALDEALFLLGERAEDLYVAEIMYHPASPLPGEAEFLELANRGATTHRLSDLRITGGIQFEFSNSTLSELAPGERLVLVRDRIAFEQAHPGIEIAGVYRGALGNSGDTFSLEQDNGTVLWTLTYADHPPWPGGTDGGGHSLSYVGGIQESASSWRPSVRPGGSPGTGDAVPFSGDDLLDYAVAGISVQWSTDDSPEFQITRKLGSDDAVVSAEWSVDLNSWSTRDLTRNRLDPTGDGLANEVWTLSEPAGPQLYFRAVVTRR